MRPIFIFGVWALLDRMFHDFRAKNSLIDVSQLYKIRRSKDFQALKL